MESPESLIIRETFEYDWIYDDSSSGADLDGSFWKAKTYSSEAFVSFVNVVSHSAPLESSLLLFDIHQMH